VSLRQVALSDVCTIVGGGTPSRKRPEFYNGTIPWLTVKDLKTTEISGAQEHITEAGVAHSAARILPAGAIVIATRITVGAVAVVRAPVAINQDLKGLIPEKEVSSEYLAWFLRANRSKLEGQASGSTVKGITTDVLARLKVPLPDLPEQRRIAALLDRAAEIRRRADAARAKARAAIPALFFDMFGDPDTLAARFGQSNFDDLVESKLLGLNRSTRDQPENGAVGYVRMNAITNDGRVVLEDLRRTEVTPTEAEAYELRRGDLLFNTRNSIELVGKMGLYSGPPGNVFNNNILRVRFKDVVSSAYVNAFFQTSTGKASIASIKKGTTSVCAVYYKDLACVTVPLPPLPLQTAFAEQVERIEAVARALDAAAVKAEAMAAALSDEVFGAGRSESPKAARPESPPASPSSSDAPARRPEERAPTPEPLTALLEQAVSLAHKQGAPEGELKDALGAAGDFLRASAVMERREPSFDNGEIACMTVFPGTQVARTAKAWNVTIDPMRSLRAGLAAARDASLIAGAAGVYGSIPALAGASAAQILAAPLACLAFILAGHFTFRQDVAYDHGCVFALAWSVAEYDDGRYIFAEDDLFAALDQMPAFGIHDYNVAKAKTALSRLRAWRCVTGEGPAYELLEKVRVKA
jgi:type I restriction enzyme, S subunit